LSNRSEKEAFTGFKHREKLIQRPCFARTLQTLPTSMRCDLPPAIADGNPRWLALYDASGPERREGEHTVFDGLLEHH
jgi:hypothetical protein